MFNDSGPGGTLALHFGQSIGWYYGGKGGIWTLPKSDDDGCIGAAVIDRLSDFQKLFQPGDFVMTGAQEVGDAATAIRHIGLLMVLKLFAYRRTAKVTVPSLAVVREAMLGRGDYTPSRAGEVALSFARRRGIVLHEPEAAHAFVLWEHERTTRRVDRRAV